MPDAGPPTDLRALVVDDEREVADAYEISSIEVETHTTSVFMNQHVVKRSGFHLVFLISLVSLAGCGGLQPADDVPTGQDAVDGHAALEAIEGTVEYRYKSAETVSNTSVSVVKRPKQGMTRQEFLAPPRLAGDITVTNGSIYWIYDASKNVATRTALGTSGPVNTSDAVFTQRLFSNLTGSSSEPVVADPPLPVGPLSVTADGPAATPVDLVGPSEFVIEYAGTETVADRRTHVIKLDPVNATNEEPGAYVKNATYWFDAEYFHPLKTTSVLTIGGERTRVTRLYRNVTFNPDIASTRFQFDPPPNATVETQSVPRPKTFDTAAGAAESVNFGVARPDVPPGYDLQTARVSRFRNRTTVSLQHGNGTHELSAVTRNPPLDTGPDGQTVSIGPVNATVTTLSEVTVYRWQCDGLGYTVRGNLPTDELREIARDAATTCSK
jgi:outer membrane lipoprotein-sorting protein